METELSIEQHLRKCIEAIGGICYKFVSPGRDSVPDRICILPGVITFVECKGPGKKPTKKQHRELKRLANLKMNVFVVSSKAQVDEVVRRMMQYVNDGESTPIPEKSES